MCIHVGRYAVGNQAGSERGQTEGDQTRTAQLRETKGWYNETSMAVDCRLPKFENTMNAFSCCMLSAVV